MIHPTAVIDPKAEIDQNVEIGAYSIVGKGVQIAAGNKIGPHVVIQGPTQLGENNTIFQFASIGGAPQDKKYADEETTLVIGSGNTIREFVTINRGTTQDRGSTIIGDNNWIMAYVHIAHDCVIGNNTTFANSASLAGHVYVDDYAILGGFTLVHQFCRIGAHCFTAMNSVISKDVPPYVMVSGHMAETHGLNTEGLKRRGFSSEALVGLKRAYKTLYRSGKTLKEALVDLEEQANQTHEVAELVKFLKQVTRGIVR
ncbi:MAG: acyl-ACP--UDP-N-acetylglucosamine O-acyltransferase [Gammaproteobacteria bacterium]|nr:acyl-ACP--UDP-N-acetylglucosamine O-acyltransferase [Gammaproteobacteria bacterium]MDH5691527.1 acyl-ACP--UDP-N-acetylglucosamine O-acyltransferase [Gammaproteobacteria bacterium]